MIIFESDVFFCGGFETHGRRERWRGGGGVTSHSLVIYVSMQVHLTFCTNRLKKLDDGLKKLG